MTLLPFHHAPQVSLWQPTVYGPSLVNEDSTVHRVWGCGGPFLSHTAEALRRCATFCDRRRCWPGKRCGTCGFPSGADDTCQACRTALFDFERRLDNAA